MDSDEGFQNEVEMVDAEKQLDEIEMDAAKVKEKVYIPGISRPLREDEEWEFDPSAYRMYHSFETPWPCLSFDTIADQLGDSRTELPATCYIVGGTEAKKIMKNELYVMKLSNLTATKVENSDDSESDDDDDDDENNDLLKINVVKIRHFGIVNRLKTTTLGDSSVCAVFNDQAKVQIWNITDALKEVDGLVGDKCISERPNDHPIFTFKGHQGEGYGLAWSPLKMGRLASGDIRKRIHLFSMGEGGQWNVDLIPLTGHMNSVEDLVWSSVEEPLLASCSSDCSIRLWDTRSPPSESCVCVVENAHESDVNVLSWNKLEPLLVSGGDDAVLKVWSLKTIQYKQPVAQFKHHKKAITSVEWSPHDATTFMASGEDDQVSIWDIALEADSVDEVAKVPPQLIFTHMGQNEPKEVHWHNQIPGMALTTAVTGMNAFIPANL